jgi:predicted Zn-dependent protease
VKISKVSSRRNRFLVLTGLWKPVIAALLLAAVSPLFANTVSLAGDTGVTDLRWRTGPIRVSVSASLLRESSNIKNDSDVAGAVKRSIDAWARVANVDIRQVTSDKLSVSPAGVAGDGVSLITIAQTPENVLLFAKDPYGAAATTRVFYNRRGIITEADIVLNPYQQFSTDGTMGTFDLESTLTHEIGHLLGLSHSEVLGSTMHANYGKNGVFGLQRLSSRTLSATDVASVRAIYGPRGEETGCCGGIEGRLSLPGKLSRTIEVWIEDQSGRVHGSTRTSPSGEFSFEGLSEGKYRLFAHEPDRSKNPIPAQELTTATVSPGEATTVAAKLVAGAGGVDFGITHLGFNAQLSEMAVSLSAGRTYTVYLGGQNLDPKDTSIRFSTPDLRVVPGSIRSQDYGDDISVISFEVRVSSRAANGEYSIFTESRSGEKRALIGGLTVDSFVNPWAISTSFDD